MLIAITGTLAKMFGNAVSVCPCTHDTKTPCHPWKIWVLESLVLSLSNKVPVFASLSKTDTKSLVMIFCAVILVAISQSTGMEVNFREQASHTLASIFTTTTTTMNTSNCSSSVDCLNETDVLSDEILEFERMVGIIVPVIFGLIFMLGLLGNSLVIVVVLFDKNMRNTTNILILSLAVADVLFVVCCVPFTATTFVLPTWPFGSIWCKIVQYLIYVCAYASVYMLVLMSFDRYLAVVHAIRSMSIRTERNTWLAVAIIWVIILAGHVPLLLQNDIYVYQHYGESRARCVNVAHNTDLQTGREFFVCFFTFGYVLPLSVVCLLYGLMLRRLHGAVPGGNQSQESIRSKRRVTRMVIIIVLFFAICWLPIQIILLVQKVGYYPTEVPFVGLQMASNCLAYMNSCVNPFLYAFLSENFRRSFRKFLCCSTQQNYRVDYELVSVRQTENRTISTCD